MNFGIHSILTIWYAWFAIEKILLVDFYFCGSFGNWNFIIIRTNNFLFFLTKNSFIKKKKINEVFFFYKYQFFK